MSVFADMWDELEARIAADCHLDPAWRAGASTEAIRAAEEVLGRQLPADYVEFLRMHDGQDQDFGVSILTAGGRLAPLSEVVARYQSRLDWHEDELFEMSDTDRVQPVVFHAGRIEIGGSIYFDGDNTALDFAPGPAGSAGQVIAAVTECDFVTIATSLTDYLRRVLEGIRSGKLRFEEARPGRENLQRVKKTKYETRAERILQDVHPRLR